MSLSSSAQRRSMHWLPDRGTLYALDLRLFLTFLSGQGVDWRAATESDLEDFEHWRRRDGGNPRRISVEVLPRTRGDREVFDGSSAGCGGEVSPVAMRERELPSGETAWSASASPLAVRSVRLKWLTPRGLIAGGAMLASAATSADGTRDASWRGP